MQELQLLNDKLDLLLKKYAAIEAENKRLEKTIAQQLNTIEALNKKLSGIEEEMTALQLSKVLPDTKEKDTMRKQVDMVIADIDKILNTLND